MNDKTATPRQLSLSEAINGLISVTTDISVKLFGKSETETKGDTEVSGSSIQRAINRITESVEKLRRANRALAKLDRK